MYPTPGAQIPYPKMNSGHAKRASTRATMKSLVTDCRTGQLSHTKLYAHAGYLAMLIGFLWQVYRTGLTAELLLAFGAIFTGSAALSKLLSLKYGAPPNRTSA